MVWNGVLIYLHSDYSSMHECLCDRLIVLCSVARCVGSFGSIIASKSFVNCCICMLSDAVVIVLRSTCDETACSENYKENSWSNCRSTVKIAVRKQGIRMTGWERFKKRDGKVFRMGTKWRGGGRMGKAAERSEQSRDQAAPFCLKVVFGYYSVFSYIFFEKRISRSIKRISRSIK